MPVSAEPMATVYSEEDVWFESDGIKIAGSFMTPTLDGPHPAVVFIHGSGHSDRTNRWYRRLAEHLLQSGISVLLPDKRGSGQSGGKWQDAGFDDLARDTIAGCAFAQGRAEVDKARIGLLGVSQGGWIAPIVATRCDIVAFIVVVSGSAVTPIRNLVHEVQRDLRRRGLPAGLASIILPLSQLLVQRRWHRWRDIREFDPIPLWEQLSVPTLFVNGAEDDNVPVSESTSLLEAANSRRSTVPIAARVFPGCGHGLFTPGSKEIRPDFLNLLVDWIMECTSGGKGA